MLGWICNRNLASNVRESSSFKRCVASLKTLLSLGAKRLDMRVPDRLSGSVLRIYEKKGLAYVILEGKNRGIPNNQSPCMVYPYNMITIEAKLHDDILILRSLSLQS